jgi:protein-S-isoprenylcysteine O-methyltransferase Ste14
MSLKSRLAVRVVLVLPLLSALIFAPAGSLRFWQGWLFVGIFVVFNAIFVAYFYPRDPGLMERRLQNKEPRREQRQFKMLWVPLWLCTLVLPGLDYRFGWSVALLGGVPVWLTCVSLVLILSAWLLVFHVLRFNSFASAIVQVEAGQRVITDGPYRVVRHPMYTGFTLLILATPCALGSFVAFVPALLLIPVLVFRLLDEERVLRQQLSGYAEYCEHTRFRLIPSLF